MNLFQTIRYGIESFGRLEAPAATRAPDSSPARSLAGGRISIDTQLDSIGGFQTILPPTAADDRWHLAGLDARTLERMPATDLMELLADLSWDVSKALWDHIRFCNPGWEVKALRPGSETVDTVAQAALDGFLATLTSYYGSPDIQFNRLFTSIFLRGAFLAELVLDPTGHMPADLATPDAASARFRRRVDDVRGPVWQLFQWQAGRAVDLDSPTIVYVPIDPFPGKPYGRSLASSALFGCVFAIGLLHDLRRVVQQQGYPRLDLVVDVEKLLSMMPEEEKADMTAVKAWVDAIIGEITTYYAQLEPDDAYVHTDVVAVNRPVGAVDASSLGAIDGLMQALDRMAAKALKMLVFDQTTNESTANRMWEVHAAGIKALQHLVETALERLLTLALQVQGIAATVEFRFAELRTAELLRDAQVANMQAQVAAYQYAQGWISQDVAAQKGAGVDTADVPEPRNAAVKAPSNLVGGQPDPGSSRQNGHLPHEDLSHFKEVTI